MKRHEPTEQDGKIALRDHVVEKAMATKKRHPDLNGEASLMAYLQDAECVRFATDLIFDASNLQDGEFAWAQPKDTGPKDGYQLFVHTKFRSDPVLPAIVAYHVARINYGEIVTSEEAELYGSALLGLSVDEYYASLCRAADSLASCGGMG